MEKTWFKGFIRDEAVRRQPWTTALHDESHRYYNFKTNPELISEVLEDYKPWDYHPGVQKFYDLIRWINSNESYFESNDCAFQGPKQNPQKDKFPRELNCSGRLMFYLRDLRFNLSPESAKVASEYKATPEVPPYSLGTHLESIGNRSLQLLKEIRPEFEWGSIALEIHPVLYDDAPVDKEYKYGYQLTFLFWAWGDTDSETLANFGVVVDTMAECLMTISSEIAMDSMDKSVSKS